MAARGPWDKGGGCAGNKIELKIIQDYHSMYVHYKASHNNPIYNFPNPQTLQPPLELRKSCHVIPQKTRQNRHVTVDMIESTQGRQFYSESDI